MPSMLEALSQFGSFSIDPPKTMQINGTFARELPQYVQKVASDYLEYGISLNSGIAKIAEAEGLNDEQTQRIIAEANNQVYMTKFASLKNNSDRRVNFDLATKEGVLAAKNAKMSKTASDNSIPKEKLTFFNYTPKYGYEVLATEAKTDFQKIAMENIGNQLKEYRGELEKRANIICQNIDTIVDALTKYEAMQKGAAQAYFTEFCKVASFEPKLQVLIKNEFEKKAKTIVGMENVELSTHDSLVKEKDFSLGGYSLAKTASEKYEKTVITDLGVSVAGVAGLSKIAKTIEEDIVSLQAISEEEKALRKEVEDALNDK